MEIKDFAKFEFHFALWEMTISANKKKMPFAKLLNSSAEKSKNSPTSPFRERLKNFVHSEMAKFCISRNIKMTFIYISLSLQEASSIPASNLKQNNVTGSSVVEQWAIGSISVQFQPSSTLKLVGHLS